MDQDEFNKINDALKEAVERLRAAYNEFIKATAELDQMLILLKDLFINRSKEKKDGVFDDWLEKKIEEENGD